MRGLNYAIATLRASGLFDSAWYLRSYPDVTTLEMDPVEHYVRIGATLGRSPSPDFDTGWYARHHDDLGDLMREPLLHFVKFGRYEGRRSKPVGGRYGSVRMCVNKLDEIDRKVDAWDALREENFLALLARARVDEPLPRVSVIMPAYNREREIGSAIESVLAQTHADWELLVVDDGSQDGTVAAVERFQVDPRVRLLRQQHGGVSRARNLGLAEATGEIVFYLDSDNTWRPRMLEVLTRFMLATGLDCAYCGARASEDGDRNAHFRGDDFCWNECRRENYLDMNAFAHRRAIGTGVGGFDESLQRLVDWDFMLRLTRDHATAYAPFCGVDYYDGASAQRITNSYYLDGEFPLVAGRIRNRLRGLPVLEPHRDTYGAEALLYRKVLRFEPARDTAIRLAYIAWDWPALSQRFVMTEIRALQARGVDVIVYYKTDPDVTAELDFEVEAFRVAGPADLAAMVRAHDRNVLHSPFAYPATTLLTWPCAIGTGLPFTFMPGGVDITHLENQRRNRVGEVASHPNCLGVVTIGSFYEDLLKRLGVPAGKIVSERQSVELPAFLPRVQVRERPLVTSIARFVEKKGLHLLIEAAARLPGFDFHMYGFGPMEASLREQAERVAPNVVFRGPLETTAELHAAYHTADLFVLPSIHAKNGDMDGTPTVLLEAMGAGVPVIASRISNIPDLIAHGQTGWMVPTQDVDALVNALRDAAALDVVARARMAERARVFIENYAGATRSADRLISLWQPALAPARAA